MAELTRQIAELARLAPSVHNTQPWRFRLDNDRLEILSDASRKLEPGDPTGRELWLSLGCVTETAMLAAQGLGAKVKLSVQTDQPNQPFAVLELIGQAVPDTELVQAIRRRRTDRSIYTGQPVSGQLLGELAESWTQPNAKIHLAADPALIGQVADLTGRGITMALNNPDFRNELAELITPGWSRRPSGIPTHSLELGPLGNFEPWRVRHGVAIQHQAVKEQNMMNSAAALALITTPGDVAADWLAAGQAYLRVAVTATQLCLASSTTAAAVEAADFHLDIEKALGTNQRLQAILRLGYSRHQPRPVRRYPLGQLLVT